VTALKWNIAEPVDVYIEGITPFTVPFILRYAVVASVYFAGIVATFELHKYERKRTEKDVVLQLDSSEGTHADSTAG
jgi:hypothetical protein